MLVHIESKAKNAKLRLKLHPFSKSQEIVLMKSDVSAINQTHHSVCVLGVLHHSLHRAHTRREKQHKCIHQLCLPTDEPTDKKQTERKGQND